MKSAICLMFLLTLPFAAPLQATQADQRSLDFEVYLDGSKIGWHRFDIRQTDSGAREIDSRANFDVKFLFITAFKYRHRNAERWQNGCLVEIEAATDSNGKKTQVTGEKTGEGFVVQSRNESRELSGCVMTFAYWNPEFLKQEKLLNPQTGEYLEVDVDKGDLQQLTIDGRSVAARPYRIKAKDVEVTVWYSEDDQWLALESLAKGGRTIRYERSGGIGA